ncbi:MAG: inorganic phosphate transporter, partial [Halobacteria archaeon]|nr:inorganic phosphate transporter [Halobacteria archaeon]
MTAVMLGYTLLLFGAGAAVDAFGERPVMVAGLLGVAGGMVGVGLALGGAPATAKYIQIAGFWLVIPFVGAGIGLTTATLLRHDRIPEEVAVPTLAGVVGVVVSNMKLAFVPSPNAQGTFAGYVSRRAGDVLSFNGYDGVMLLTSLVFALVFFAVIRYSVNKSVDRGVKNFLIFLGALVVFSSGGSQVGLATGPLETLFDSLELPGVYLLLLGGSAILIGAWMGAPRVVQAVSREYSELGIRRSIS